MAGGWNIDAHDAFIVAAELAGAGAKVAERAVLVTRHYGLLVQNQAKANASGRPGPRAITGDFRRSITSVVDRTSATDVAAEIGTNKPQGRRLEFGFHGTDSLGRNYNQPPYPYLGPALDKIGPDYAEAIGAIVETI